MASKEVGCMYLLLAAGFNTCTRPACLLVLESTTGRQSAASTYEGAPCRYGVQLGATGTGTRHLLTTSTVVDVLEAPTPAVASVGCRSNGVLAVCDLRCAPYGYLPLHVGTRNGAPLEEGGSQEIVMVPAHPRQGIIPALLFVCPYGVTYLMGPWRLMELHQASVLSGASLLVTSITATGMHCPDALATLDGASMISQQQSAAEAQGLLRACSELRTPYLQYELPPYSCLSHVQVQVQERRNNNKTTRHWAAGRTRLDDAQTDSITARQQGWQRSGPSQE